MERKREILHLLLSRCWSWLPCASGALDAVVLGDADSLQVSSESRPLFIVQGSKRLLIWLKAGTSTFLYFFPSLMGGISCYGPRKCIVLDEGQWCHIWKEDTWLVRGNGTPPPPCAHVSYKLRASFPKIFTLQTENLRQVKDFCLFVPLLMSEISLPLC